MTTTPTTTQTETSLTTDALLDQLIDLVIPPSTDSAPAPVAAPPVYWIRDDAPFTPRRGFETVLYNALLEQRTETETVNYLLSSGDYYRVAPRAAELRPTKPTRFLLKTWTAQGILRRSN